MMDLINQEFLWKCVPIWYDNWPVVMPDGAVQKELLFLLIDEQKS